MMAVMSVEQLAAAMVAPTAQGKEEVSAVMPVVQLATTRAVRLVLKKGEKPESVLRTRQCQTASPPRLLQVPLNTVEVRLVRLSC
mmetsp:Transcript_43203/g.80005  ORF Transcript_43203/g.80005 Transcript_43203/m.80005 type:complete len:85 (+) Transcript_43203:557-811(+)